MRVRTNNPTVRRKLTMLDAAQRLDDLSTVPAIAWRRRHRTDRYLGGNRL